MTAMDEKTNLPKIGQPATQALEAAGVTRMEQLCEWREKDLLKLHGVGPKAIRILKEVMAEKGLSFNE
jgi:predicted flap endonuclease-1-like 5' DNA nuclease